MGNGASGKKIAIHLSLLRSRKSRHGGRKPWPLGRGSSQDIPNFLFFSLNKPLLAILYNVSTAFSGSFIIFFNLNA